MALTIAGDHAEKPRITESTLLSMVSILVKFLPLCQMNHGWVTFKLEQLIDDG